MPNFISENRKLLETSNYIRQAGTDNFWFDFSNNVLMEYLQRIQREVFNLVLFRPGESDDAFVLPYSHFASVFNEENLDQRGRWIGTINDNVLRLHRPGIAVSVSNYYNAFDWLAGSDDGGIREQVKSATDQIRFRDIHGLISEFNQKYASSSPLVRRTVSERIARPGIITDVLKKYRDYRCQLCQEVGFIQRNGTPYIEAHHISELHKLIPGSYCSDNIVVVCPTCHRKLHYADVSYDIQSEMVLVRISEIEQYTFERNSVTNLESGES